MRSLLLFVVTVLAACEHEPPPAKKSPPAQPTPPPAGDPTKANTPPANPPPQQPPAQNTPPADAAVDAPAEPTQPCLDMGTHLAEVMLAEAKDPSQKAALEQDKTKIVRRAAEACTRDSWKPEVLACFAKATTTEQMQICAKDLAAPSGG